MPIEYPSSVFPSEYVNNGNVYTCTSSGLLRSEGPGGLLVLFESSIGYYRNSRTRVGSVAWNSCAKHPNRQCRLAPTNPLNIAELRSPCLGEDFILVHMLSSSLRKSPVRHRHIRVACKA